MNKLNKGDWFKLKAQNDWGSVYFSPNPLDERGYASFRRNYLLIESEPIVVRLKTGEERAGIVSFRDEIETISDHGSGLYGNEVRNKIPFVSFEDGTEIRDITSVELRYNPNRDPTATEE